MAKTSNAQTRAATRTDRPTYTLELATAICPDEGLTSRLSRVFSIEPVDFPDIADSTKAALIQAMNALIDNLSEKASPAQAPSRATTAPIAERHREGKRADHHQEAEIGQLSMAMRLQR